MVTKTLEAPSVEGLEKKITHDDVLRKIPQYYIDSVILQEHLDREVVVGTVGDRGGGKSGTDAVLGIVAFMLAGKPVWSNMMIACDIEITDEMAREHGLNKGGVAHYESLPLEKSALLRLDETYRGGCLVIEEINVQYSNVRRFMSNTNVDFNEVCQQLRKFRTSMIYNVIDEMFIDPQLRALTDIFISTYDTAFDRDALIARKQTGIDFKWKIYPMSGYLRGEQGKYNRFANKNTIDAFFHFKPWRGVFNSFKHQEKGVYTMSTRDRNKALQMGVEVESSPETTEFNRKWGWLGEIAIRIRNEGTEILNNWELAEEIGKPLTREIREALQTFGISYDRFAQAYRVNNYKVERESGSAAQL